MTKQVLVVDDDDGVREIIRLSLETAGDWSVQTAASGRAGVAIAQNTPLDLILLDVMMPEEDGLEVYKQLQSAEKTKGIPTILLTAKAQMSEQQAFMSLGIQGVITKPFQAKSLVAEIEQILGWS